MMPIDPIFVGIVVLMIASQIVSSLRPGTSETHSAEALEARREFEAAAQTLGLRTSSDGPETRASGLVSGCEVTLVLQNASATVDYVVQTRGLLTLRRRSLGSALDVSAAYVATGDPEFDEQVRVTGDEAEVTAALSSEVRAAALVAVGIGAHHERGWRLTASIQSAGRVVECVKVLTSAAALRPDDLLTSLEERCADPEPRVRALAVQRLVRHLSASPDVDGQRLVDLAAWIDDRALQVELAERAGPAGVPLLRTLLSDGNRQVRRRAALTLAARLPEAPEPDLEAALVDLLPSGDVEVCLKVARWGTVAAVPALLALEKTSRDRTVREAARAAVTQLQRAVGTQARGGLTIAADGSGQLSTAAPAGDLSLDARVSPGPTRARP